MKELRRAGDGKERNKNLPGGQRIAGRSGPTGTEYGRKDERKKLVGDRWMRKDQGWLYVAKDCSSGQLAGMFFVVLPGMEEENLGYDIGMQGRQLYECAIMDTVVVLPEYRGMHLQYEMMQTAERKLHKEGYRYLLCTVHPENKFSRENVKRQGYKKILTKEKYGGFLRGIWMKEL